MGDGGVEDRGGVWEMVAMDTMESRTRWKTAAEQRAFWGGACPFVVSALCRLLEVVVVTKGHLVR